MFTGSSTIIFLKMPYRADRSLMTGLTSCSWNWSCMPDYYDIHLYGILWKDSPPWSFPFLDPVLEFFHMKVRNPWYRLWFRQGSGMVEIKGFKPTGFEKSAGMAGLARKIQVAVVQGDFLDHDFPYTGQMPLFCQHALFISPTTNFLQFWKE